MAMVVRFLLTVLSVVAAFFMMRLMLHEGRRLRVPVKDRDSRPPHRIARLKQDPETGVYYPAD
ncbi:MAG TPA: hypothetical protein VIB38_02080 [Aestuariivirgaceae bacterium]|jgi:hypothetical protein